MSVCSVKDYFAQCALGGVVTFIHISSCHLQCLLSETQKHILLGRTTECFLNTSVLEVKTWRYDDLPTNNFSIGPMTFYHSAGMDTFLTGLRGGSNSCLISQLWYFKWNPYFWGKTPVQVRLLKSQIVLTVIIHQCNV